MTKSDYLVTFIEKFDKKSTKVDIFCPIWKKTRKPENRSNFRFFEVQGPKNLFFVKRGSENPKIGRIFENFVTFWVLPGGRRRGESRFPSFPAQLARAKGGAEPKRHFFASFTADYRRKVEKTVIFRFFRV